MPCIADAWSVISAHDWAVPAHAASFSLRLRIRFFVSRALSVEAWHGCEAVAVDAVLVDALPGGDAVLTAGALHGVEGHVARHLRLAYDTKPRHR